MTEVDESFSGVDGVFKFALGNLIPIRDALPIKTNESVGYGVLPSYN